jgi:peroxiredoxin
MPSLDVLADWQGADRLRVVAVDVRESSGRAERFMADRNLHLHVLQDPDALIAKRFGVSLYPTTLLIDGRGRARWKIEGSVDWSSAEAQGWIDTLNVP